jgi:L-lysine exporter family protein LysE/ArgO
MRWAGVAFLAAYAGFALRRAWRPSALAAGGAGAALPLGQALAQACACTFLNPHVYLDTVLLLGSLANTHGLALRWAFLGGAVCASAVWFFGLGYGARLLAPVFAKPSAWRLLDTLIALVMVVIAVGLAVRPLA